MHRPLDFLSVIVAVFAVSFYLYWAVSASGVKKDVPEKGSRAGWALARIGLIASGVAVYRLPVFSPFWDFATSLTFFNNSALRIAGVILTALGFSFAVWARRHLGRNWSAQPAKKIDHELVTSGPYHFVRHPIYTGVLTAWFGFGLVNGPISMLVFLALALIFSWRVGVEDSYMSDLFPDQYPAYRAGTKALIPLLW